MESMTKCSSCSGLVPNHELVCPHCDAHVSPKARSRVAAALAFVSAGAASVTLMACYGMPPCDYKAGDGTTKRDGIECKNVCVAPDSEAAKRCYETPTDAGADAGFTADAGRDGG